MRDVKFLENDFVEEYQLCIYFHFFLCEILIRFVDNWVTLNYDVT